MKKFLALVLALVMTMSLVTISAGAEDFTDDASITYEEAVDVMAAIGVVGGYADGSFNPKGTLTRGAAAKIICNMILGPTEAGALAAVEAPFKDVPADHVFSGYIAYCVSEGIVSGYADGTFRPAGTLTGYAFMKMLLGALGYDANTEGYTGANFAINVAKRALNIGLDAGLEGDFVGTKALTREEACLYAFNTLKADMVEYLNNQSITIGDIVISNSTKATTIAAGAADYSHGTAGDATLQFCEQYFPTLKTAAGNTDDFSRPANYKWYLDKNKNNTFTAGKDTEIVNIMDTADYTVTVEADVATPANATAMAAAINTLLKLTKASDVLTYAGNIFVNGDQKTLGSVTLLAGDEVEVYVDTNNQITSINVIRYELAKVKSVTALSAAVLKSNANSADPEVVAATSNVVLTVANGSAGADLSAIYDTKIVDFDYAKNDYILVALKADSTEVYASKLADTVEGTVSATKGSTYKLDSKFYGIATNTVGAVTAGNGVTGKWVLDAAGKLAAAIDITAKSGDYAYIYSINKASGAGDNGLGGNTYTVYAVTNEGEKVAYTAATVAGTTTGEVYLKGQKDVAAYRLDNLSAGTNAKSLVTAYKVVEDKFESVAAAATINSVNSTDDLSKVNAVFATDKYATNDTTFVFVDISGTTLKVTKTNGYKNVNIDASADNYIAVTDATTKAASVVFVIGAPDALNASADATLAVLLDTAYVQTGTGTTADPYVYTYSIVVGAEETTLAQDAPITWGTIAAGDVFYYTLDSAGVATVTEAGAETVAAVIDANNIQTSTTGAIDLSEVDLYTLTVDTSVTPTTYTVTEGATFSATSGNDGYNVRVYIVNTAVKAIYVVNTIV